MTKIAVDFDEVEMKVLEEYARQVSIPLQEAIRRCVRYVLQELSPQIRKQHRSDMFWEHYQHLRRILSETKINKGGWKE